MTQLETLEKQSAVLAKPYAISRSRLGIVTKLFGTRFLCNEQGIHDLNDSITEKLRQLTPTSGGFQYLLSFGDKTHFEHQDLGVLNSAVRNSAKTTERLVLKWIITHPIEGVANELTLIVRISNPINPFIMLQAILSKSPEDIDNLEFENGSVSASVDGAGQITAEEIFAVVGKWIDSRPQPQYITGIHERIHRHLNKLQFANYWLFPSLLASIFLIYLWKWSPTTHALPLLFAAIIVHSYAREATQKINQQLERWSHLTRRFSIFSLTGGDINQQAKFASKSKNSLVKLIAATSASVISNVIAGIVTALLLRV